MSKKSECEAGPGRLAHQQTLSVKFSTSAQVSRAVFQMMKLLLEAVGLDESGRDRLMLAVGEAIDNAVIHGNKFETDKLIEVEYRQEPNRLIFSVADQGIGFGYQKHMETPINEYDAPKLMAKAVKFGSPGGLGLALIRKCANEVAFTPPGNRITFIKNLDS